MRRIWYSTHELRRRMKHSKEIDGCRYTMLIAWHKFDNYERTRIAEFVGVDLNKLPFVFANMVWHKLDLAAEKLRLTPRQWLQVPLHDYCNRILRAIRKQNKKSRKRVRERIK